MKTVAPGARPLHTIDTLRRARGRKAMIASPGHLYPKRANGYRLKLAVLEEVHRKNVILLFEDGQRWRWPADSVVLAEDPVFDEVYRAQERAHAEQERHDRRVRELGAERRARTLATRRRRSPKRPRDSQRSKVYAWETRVLAELRQDELALDACAAWIDATCRALGFRLAIRVKDGRGARRAHWVARGPDRGEIALPRTMRRPYVLAHELAHALCHAHFGPAAVPSHGPEFVRMLVDLLVRFVGLDRRQLERSLAAARVEIAPVSVLADERPAPV